MASRRTNEQCLTWLRSMAADKNSLDGINAELCLNLIYEQKERLEKLGAQFHQVQTERNKLRDQIHLEDIFDPSRRDEMEDLGFDIKEF